MRKGRLVGAIAVLALAGAIASWAVVPALADTGTATPEATAVAAPTDEDTEVAAEERVPLLRFTTVAEFDAVAEALGLTPTELFEQWHDGLTLSEIAEAQGVDIDAVREALRTARHEAAAEAAKAEIDAAVEAGTITQEEADWLLEGIEQGYTSGFGLLRGEARLGHARGLGASGLESEGLMGAAPGHWDQGRDWSGDRLGASRHGARGGTDGQSDAPEQDSGGSADVDGGSKS